MSDELNMADMFGKMMEMRQKISAAQEELGKKTVSVEAGGGMVRVSANGLQRITSIKVDPDALDEDDVELVEDLIVAGVNKALDQAADMAKAEMGRAAGDMLPPGFDLTQLGL